ncbi:MAG: BMC domain-containing protein [Desulfovibrio sp.]|uniref:BMC domain-containing protein n=1 Tax=Desulfovibrio sp. 7SRBS1 TaxID=3378064 RepID=UPI003B3C987F
MMALGFIETNGFLAAVEAADAMLKAADVRLLEKILASGGLVTVSVTGEVAAVQAAVDAGVAMVERIDGAVLISRHVIPRPDEEISRIIKTTPPDLHDDSPDDFTPPFGTGGAAVRAAITEPAETETPESPSGVASETPEVRDISEEPKTSVEEPAGEPAQETVDEAPDGETPAEDISQPQATAQEEERTEAPAKDAAEREEPKRHTVSQLKKMSVTRLRQLARSLEGIAMPQDKISTARKKDLIDSIVNVYRQIEE